MKTSLLAVVCAIPAFAQLAAVPDGTHAQVRAAINTSLANGVAITGSYTNPAWIVSIPYSKVTGLSGSGPISFSGGVIGCVTASGSLAGCLSASDWAAFNAKQAPLGFTPLNAAGNLSDLGSVSIARTNLGLGSMALKGATTSTAVQKGDGSGGLTGASYTDITSLFSTCSGVQYLGADGACHAPTAGITATAPIVNTSGVLSCVAATGSVAGCLSAADWTTFNAKQANLGYMPLNPANNLSELVATATTARTNLGLGTISTKGATSGALVQRGDGAGGLSAATGADIVALFSTCSGTQYLGADAACHTPAVSSGTVQSVNLTMPSWFTVTNPTPTSTVAMTVTPTAGQPANQFLATPSGSTGAIGLRSIVAADIPTLNQNTTGTAAALAANGTNCPAGSYPLGVDASGNSESCTVAAGSGTVTSVTLAATPGWLTVTNPTVSTNGTITLGATSGQSPNQVLATPNISTGAVALRSLVPGDIPTIPLGTGVSGTLLPAQAPAFTGGDVTSTAGTLALNVAAIGGVAVPSGGTGNTGSGSVVRAISPTLQGPALGTVASGDISAVTGTANSLTSGLTKALKSATTNVDVSLATAPTGGQVLTAQDSTHAVWQTVTGTGTVTSVGITVPPFLAAGPAVTGAGNLAVTAAPGQTANQVLATPNGATGAAGLRSLVPADIPVLNQNTTGTANNVTGVVAVANGGSGASTSTGSGSIVLQTNPALIAPALGAATATSINKVAITPQLTGSTLTIADGKALTASNSLTLTGTDGSSVAFGAGGTAAYTGNNLGAFASTTSAQLAGVLNDETGSGLAVFATNPVLQTPNLGIPSAVVLTNATGTATGLTSGITNALKSATTTVDVSAATAPSSGQVLTASDGTHATWLTPSGGGGGGGISAVNAQTGTTYTVLNTDCGKLVTFSNASPVAVTLPQAGASGNFVATCSIRMVDLGTGTVTVTPQSTSLINGATPYVLTTGQGALLVSDGTNYIAQNGKAGALTTQLDGSTIGTGVTSLNILTGPDMTPTLTQAGNVASLQYAPNGARWATRDQVQSDADRYCSPSSASSSAYACVHAHPLTAYTAGMTQIMRFDVTGSGGAITVALDSLLPKKIFGPDGTTALTTSQSAAGVHGLMIYDGSLDSNNGGWKFQTGGTSSSSSSGIPYVADTGTTNALVIAPSPAISYTNGVSVLVKVLNTNSGAATINANGLGSKKVVSGINGPLPGGAMSATSIYLLTYNSSFDGGAGAFELTGTGACISHGVGITCNGASGNYITMLGSTSGNRTYTTEAVGAGDNVTIAGYATTPTAGNCAQWSAPASGSSPILVSAGAPCGSGGSTGIKNLYSKTAAANINGVGAATWNCTSNCGVPDVSLFTGTEKGAVLNLTGVTTPNAQDQFVVPGGYSNQAVTVEMHYFTSADTNAGHSGTWTLTYYCGSELIGPTYAAAGSAVSLPGITTSTQEAVVTTSFTPSGCSAGQRMSIKSVWSQGTLTYLAATALRLYATF